MKKKKIISLGLVIAFYLLTELLILTGNLSRLMQSLLVPLCAYMIAAVGLNVNVGYSGELNLGQAGFMAIGGFSAVVVSCVLETVVGNEIIILILSIICGGMIAGLVGWLISIPVLKLEGDYLAIVTLAFGQIVVSLINNLYVGLDEAGLHFSFVSDNLQMSESGRTIVSGPMGTVGINSISTFTVGIVVLIASLLLVYNLLDSKYGRSIMACRDNRIAAMTVGIDARKSKTLAFVVSSFLGGCAGGLYALGYASVSASKFDYNTSIMILVYVVLGGLGNLTGCLVATGVLVVLPEMLRFLSNYRMLIYSIVLIVIMLVTNNDKFKQFKFRKGGHKHGTSITSE